MTAILKLTAPALLALLMLPEAASAGQEDASPFTRQGIQWPTGYLEESRIETALLRSNPPEEVPQSYDNPESVPFDLAPEINSLEPVILLSLNGELRAYPMRTVAAHRIINDNLNGTAVAVTYCRICSSSMVFRSRVAGKDTKLRLTGLSYDQNIVLYDDESRTWWQQINGFGLAGPNREDSLEVLPSKLESWASLRRRSENGERISVILPSGHMAADFKIYDPADLRSDMVQTAGLDPLARVVVVDNQAWPLDLLRQRGQIEEGDIVLRWSPGRIAGPDAFGTDKGRDVGIVEAHRRSGESMLDIDSRVQLLHAFLRFNPDGKLRLKSDGYAID